MKNNGFAIATELAKKLAQKVYDVKKCPYFLVQTEIPA